MSRTGIVQTAAVFDLMQRTRERLVRGATAPPIALGVDRQDLLLARLLEDMNDFAKERFSEITMGDER